MKNTIIVNVILSVLFSLPLLATWIWPKWFANNSIFFLRSKMVELVGEENKGCLLWLARATFAAPALGFLIVALADFLVWMRGGA
jgi:hypothetical protein